jgi:hypothetical protein
VHEQGISVRGVLDRVNLKFTWLMAQWHEILPIASCIQFENEEDVII